MNQFSPLLVYLNISDYSMDRVFLNMDLSYIKLFLDCLSKCEMVMWSLES